MNDEDLYSEIHIQTFWDMYEDPNYMRWENDAKIFDGEATIFQKIEVREGFDFADNSSMHLLQIPDDGQVTRSCSPKQLTDKYLLKVSDNDEDLSNLKSSSSLNPSLNLLNINDGVISKTFTPNKEVHVLKELDELTNPPSIDYLSSKPNNKEYDGLKELDLSDFFKPNNKEYDELTNPSDFSKPNNKEYGLKELDELTNPSSIDFSKLNNKSSDTILEEFDCNAMNNDSPDIFNDVCMLNDFDCFTRKKQKSKKRKPTNKLLGQRKKKSKKMKTRQFVDDTYEQVKKYYKIDEEYLQHDDIINYIFTFCKECSPTTCLELTENIIGSGDHNILYTKMDRFYRKKRARDILFIRLRRRQCKRSSKTIFQSNKWLTLNEYLLNPTYKNEVDGKYHYVVILDQLISHLYLFLRYCYKTRNI